MAQDPEILKDRGRSLEDEFFRREDARLKEKLRETAQREGAREDLARASGIKNPAIVERLLALGVRPETVTALSLVPLVEVAWADGSLDDNERRVILERAGTSGLAPGSTEHALLDDSGAVTPRKIARERRCMATPAPATTALAGEKTDAGRPPIFW